jgi:hypothetical protein
LAFRNCVHTFGSRRNSAARNAELLIGPQRYLAKPLQLLLTGFRRFAMIPPPNNSAAEPRTVVPTQKARQGVAGQNVRYVLGWGLAAVIVAFGIIYLIYFH